MKETEKIVLRPDAPNRTEMFVYLPEKRTHAAGIVIFPGGGYWDKAEHEGAGYAAFLNAHGYAAFVVMYSTKHQGEFYYPEQLLDARAAFRYLHANEKKYGLNGKLFVMGSSAGGHLAALLSSCREEIAGEQREPFYGQNYLPDGQILCYPVIELYGKNAHVDSAKNLLGPEYSEEACRRYSPNLCAQKGTPPAFLWHTFTDSCVSVQNSLDYALRLCEIGTETELHIYPCAEHGQGLADFGEEDNKYISDWPRLLLRWLERQE